MNYSSFIEYLQITDTKYREASETSSLVTMKVGGRAKIIVFPHSVEVFCDILTMIKEEKFVVIGKGSNSVFTSGYYDGIVIVTTLLDKIYVDNTYIIAQCGVSVSQCCIIAMNSSLSGLEFAYGIPGSIGGAVYMNASAFDSAFDSIVYESKVFDLKTSSIVTVSSIQHRFAPKSSVFMEKALILLETKLLLNSASCESIRLRMSDNISRRIKTQPLNLPSAGSAFKRPKLYYASRLIDEAGLKGKRVGDAMVSTKHAGFIVNVGNASSQDILNLASIIEDTVYKKFKVKLEKEFEYIE